MSDPVSAASATVAASLSPVDLFLHAD
ncbi:hypothetical protein DES32_0001, partial [Methylovirgula ligni]